MNFSMISLVCRQLKWQLRVKIVFFSLCLLSILNLNRKRKGKINNSCALFFLYLQKYNTVKVTQSSACHFFFFFFGDLGKMCLLR